MRILIFILTLCAGILSVTAQNTLLERRITITLKAVPMEEAIEKIAETAGVNVSYSSDLLASCSPVSIEAQNQALITVLNKVFASYKIGYTAHAGQLILFPKRTIVVKNHTTRGTICDEETELPISYATLQVKGKSQGVVADHKGFFVFTLTDMELSDSLTASCM